MKKVILIALLSVTYLGLSQAQVELKVNPVRILIFNSADLVGEYIVNENIGVELGAGVLYGDYGKIVNLDFDRSGARLFAAGKYYFIPKNGGDNLYAGIYLRPKKVSYVDNNLDDYDYGFKQSSFGVGLMAGYKWVGNQGLIFELGAGFGRGVLKKNTYNDNSNTIKLPSLKIDGFLRLSVGYRFGGNN